MKTLTIDTETTGKLVKDLPLTDLEQPHCVEIAALWHVDDKPVGRFSAVIKPDAWKISDEVAGIHGITQPFAEQAGISEAPVARLMVELVSKCDLFIAFNTDFDWSILRILALNHGLELPDRKKFCVMKLMTNVCQMPRKGTGGFKFPKLSEAYEFAFGTADRRWHNALTDARCCYQIYRWLIERKQNHEHA